MHKDIILYGVILLFILWIFIEQKLLMTTRQVIVSERLPGSLNHTSFVVLADLHNRTFGTNNTRLIKRIDALAPDFILAAGDIINKKNACYPGGAFELLDQLSDRYKIFFAYGNHEQRMEQIGKKLSSDRTSEENALYTTWIEFKNRLRRKDVIFLDNESVTMELRNTKIKISGVSLGHEYFKFNDHKTMDPGYLQSLLGPASKELYQLLIAHNPVYFTDYADWGADLTLSGHLHGGMMRLPGIGGVISPQARFFPKYDSGIFHHDNRQMVVSRGLGSHSVMPRIFNIPELVSITLESGKPEKTQKH